MQIDDVSPTAATFSGSLLLTDQWVSGKGLCIAISADGERAYLGGHSGVWRSDDGGETWWHPEWLPAFPGGTTRAGALPLTNVYDLLIDPHDSDVVLACTGRDGHTTDLGGIYRSTDGARTWTLAHRFVTVDGGMTRSGTAGQLAPVPDDPLTVYAAGDVAIAWTTDGGVNWVQSVPNPFGGALHVVAGHLVGGSRRVYAAGFGVRYSLDSGATWHTDPAPRGLAEVTDGAGSGARSLAIHPLDDDVIYLMQDDLTLWKGVYPPAPSTAPAVWTQLASPPIGGGTDSGATFVVPFLSEDGFISLYASDRRTVHSAVPDPTAETDWVLIEDGHCHVDPHGLALSRDFRQWSPDFDPPTWGRAVRVGDGGVNVTVDGMQTWSNAHGLATLNVANVAVNVGPRDLAAITFRGGDDFGFSTSDGGATWRTQVYLGGDNDCSFADLTQPDRTVLFAPRSKPANGVTGEIYLCAGQAPNPPSTALGTPQLQRIPAPPPATAADTGKPVRGWNAVSNFWAAGYRPLVLTPAGHLPRPDGDLVTIRFTGVVGQDPALLLRTTALSGVHVDTDWVTSVTTEGPGVVAFQVGPPLPDPRISTVQASGGHDAPTFYVGNQTPLKGILFGSPLLWTLAPGDAAWRQIVPAAAGPAVALRYHADPYRPGLVYVLGDDGVYRTTDGGASWHADTSLTAAVTDGGAYPFDLGTADRGNSPQDSVLRDMEFDPTRPGFRLATGIAGVFLTTDGTTWRPLLRSTAMSIQPTSLFYDWLSCERSVYVGTSNRGLLRIHPLPPDWEFPRGSLQAAVGRVTLLRVHDIGTGYGPPSDFTDAEVIVWIDTQPEKAFALRLRTDAHRAAAEGMLGLLRDAFTSGNPMRIEFVRTGCRIGDIVRVIEP